MFVPQYYTKTVTVQFQFIELNGCLMWCDFGANLVQHFIKRYSRYSRYRTKSHDKATISHVFPRYSRYQTVLLKLKEISYYFSYTKSSASAELFVLREGRPIPYGTFMRYPCRGGVSPPDLKGRFNL